jgi:preprotein translocase subunit SecA
MNFFNRSIRTSTDKRGAAAFVASTRQTAASLASISDQQLKTRFRSLQSEHAAQRDRDPSPLDDRGQFQFGSNQLVDATALAMEALNRTHQMMAYDVQVQAGYAMVQGAVAEMQTGEGKTLTTMFPVVAFALAGNGVHVATVNQYLAERDCEFLRPALEILGISVGLSASGAAADEKRNAYACDVTFATGYELGFDFLRDQIARRHQPKTRLGNQVLEDLFGEATTTTPLIQRGFSAAIIDEVDSVLIDEAITPLVLSAGALGESGSPNEPADKSVYLAAKQVAAQLQIETDFSIDTATKSLTLTQQGNQSIHQRRDILFHCSGRAEMPQLLRPWRLYVEAALRAQHLMIRDSHYVMNEGAVEIVDEYTGRIFSDRNWRDGLHQAVEAKEQVEITEERKTIAKISRQRFFQRYPMLCGMTGTADGHQNEFLKFYELPIIIIDPRKPNQRIELPTHYFADQQSKINAVVADTIIRSGNGQPVLIATRTIQQSQMIAENLTARAVAFQIVNGVQDEDEATVISKAGFSGMVTVATNMAGRGTDIKPDDAAIQAGGLHVIGFDRNTSGRIDRQLAGRSGRQGNPGSAQFFVSAEDELLVRFDPPAVRKILHLCATNPHDGIESTWLDRRMSQLQRKVEQANFKRRIEAMREELWLDKVKKVAS